MNQGDRDLFLTPSLVRCIKILRTYYFQVDIDGGRRPSPELWCNRSLWYTAAPELKTRHRKFRFSVPVFTM